MAKRVEALQKAQQNTGAGGGGLVVPIENAKKAYEAAKVEAEKLGEQIKQNEKDAYDANTPIEEQKKHYQEVLDQLIEQRRTVEQSITASNKLGGVAKGLKPFFEELTLAGLNKQIDEASGKLSSLMGNSSGVVDGGNKAYWEKRKADAEAEKALIGTEKAGSKRWKELAKEIDNATNKLAIYDNKQKKVAEKDKPQPFGSIAYWEQVSRKAQEVIDKTPSSNSSLIFNQSKIKLEADKKAEDIRKSYAIKSFEDEINEKRGQFELYQRWVEAYGKDAADKQFATLVQGNQSYLEYLNSEIRKLESTANFTALNKKDTASLDFLNSERNKVTGKDTGIEVFKQQLEDAQENANSLTQALGNLKVIQSQLGQPHTADEYEKTRSVAEKILEVEKQRQRALSDFLKSVVGSEQKRLEIQAFYAEQRASADKRFADKSSKAYINAIADINKAEADEYDKFYEEKVVNSKGYKELQDVLKNAKAEETKIKITALKEQLKNLRDANLQETEEYKQKLRDLNQAEIDHRQRSIQNWNEIGMAIGQVGGALEEMGGTVGEVGGAMNGLGSQTGNISKMFDQSTTSTDRWAAAIQGVVQIITVLVAANKRRHEQEKQFALDRIKYENDYAIALNNKLGEEYNHNPFYRDYDGEIKAGAAKYQDAQNKFYAALDKLEAEGRAKQRQKDVVDGKSVGQLAGAGAAVGAAIGGIVGVGVFSVATAAVGAIIGGAVGAIGGLFAKKKKDIYGSILGEYPELIKKSADGFEELDVAMAQALITNNQVDAKTKELLENAIALHEQLEEAREQIIGTVKDLTGEIGNELSDSLVAAFRSGEDAAEAFHKKMGDIIADIAYKLLFAKIIGPYLDQFVEEATKSLTPGGDGSIIDDLDRFDKYSKDGVVAMDEASKQLDQWFQDHGFDPIRGSGKETSPVAKQGAITGASEEAINILNGQINAIRITQSDGLMVARDALFQLTAINKNTAELYSIRADMTEIRRALTSDWLRATGG